MSIYVEVNEIRYPAVILGKLYDDDWDNRDSKAITIEMPYEEAKKIFVDDINWKIIQEHEELVNTVDENTGEIVQQLEIISEIHDNSEYSIAGDITDHRNGKITVKMGKPTSEELLNMIMEVL